MKKAGIDDSGMHWVERLGTKTGPLQLSLTTSLLIAKFWGKKIKRYMEAKQPTRKST